MKVSINLPKPYYDNHIFEAIFESLLYYSELYKAKYKKIYVQQIEL